jgi:hypothetical protein
VGPPRSGETSRLSSRDPVASGVKCGHMVARKARRSRGQESVHVVAHDRSLHAGFAAVHHKTVELLG